MSIRRAFLQNINNIIPIANLIAEWRLSVNSIDSVGGNNGTDTSITYTNGEAVFQGGSTSNINVSDADILSFVDANGDLPFSVTMKVNFNSFSGNLFFFGKDGSTNSREYLIGATASNQLTCFIFKSDNTGRLAIRQQSSLSTNTDYYFTQTYDGSKTVGGLKMYINKVIQTTTNVSSGTYTGMSNTSSDLIIGNSAFISNAGINGTMKDIRLWDKELSQEEVTAIDTMS
jgi:hypothetical protein